ncbi:peptidylprolyl isomerase [Candidatus Berkelbacteria bacterium]|nr:peptidylprolyl isomerase [Candidatus Berkelbacteria bacterium]
MDTPRQAFNATDFPKWLPWTIAGLLFLYLLSAAIASALLLRGNDASQVRALARWLPVPVARVDGQLIWAREYLDYRAFIETFIARSNQAEEAIDTGVPVGQQVINLLVANKTVQRAGKEEGITVTEAEVNGAFDDILVAQGGDAPRQVSEEELNTILEELYGSTQDQLRDLIRVRLIEEKIKGELIEQVHFRHILVRDEGRANDVLERLKAGQVFEELAKEFSEHLESRDLGGEMGFVSRGGQSQVIEQALFTNPVGLVQSPVQSDFGFHLIEILEKKGHIQQSFDAWLTDAEARYRANVYLRLPAA